MYLEFMLSRLKISNKVTIICLLRLEKRQGTSSSFRANLIRKLNEELPKTLLKENLGKLEDQFFVLGGASTAMLISGLSLNETAQVKETIINTLNSLLNKGLIELDCDIFAFPVVSTALGRQIDPNKPLPILVFMRTGVEMNRLLRISALKVCEDVSIMVGYGSHQIVCYSRCTNLSGIREKVNGLARKFGKSTETCTIVGVPYEKDKDKERQFADYRFLFHTALKLSEPSSARKLKVKIGSIVKDDKYAYLFEGLTKRDIVGYTPGRMDLTLNFKSSCVTDAFGLACALGDLEEVIDTVTWPDFSMS